MTNELRLSKTQVLDLVKQLSLIPGKNWSAENPGCLLTEFSGFKVVIGCTGDTSEELVTDHRADHDSAATVYHDYCTISFDGVTVYYSHQKDDYPSDIAADALRNLFKQVTDELKKISKDAEENAKKALLEKIEAAGGIDNLVSGRIE